MQGCCCRNKRGLILHETVIGIVVGLLAVLVLFLLAGNLYGMIFGSEDESRAKAILQNIREAISSLSLGETTRTAIMLESPKGWWLVSFDKESEKPDECKDESCICICQKATDCTKNAFCDGFKKPLYKEGRPASLQIDLQNIYLKNRDNFYEILEKPEGAEEIKIVTDYELPSKPRQLAEGQTLQDKIDRVIFHHTGSSTFLSAFHTFNNSKGALSVHYIVDRDGTVYYLIDESMKANHAGVSSYNHRSIGIEIVNTGNKSMEYTESQYNTIKKLLQQIAGRWENIKIDDEHILGHYEIRSGKWDPSPNFDWARIGLPDHIPMAIGATPKEMGYRENV